MYPILFSFNIRDIFIEVYSIGLCMLIGFIVFNYYITKFAIYKQLDPKFWFNHIITFTLLALIGSRLFYVLENLERYRDNLSEIFIPDGFSNFIPRTTISWCLEKSTYS